MTTLILPVALMAAWLACGFGAWAVTLNDSPPPTWSDRAWQVLGGPLSLLMSFLR